jgi:hypothetical protein
VSNSRKLRRAAWIAQEDQARAYAADPGGERQARHMTFIRQNSARLVPAARDAYREHGRGAFLVEPAAEWTPGNTAARYVTDAEARAFGGWPDEATARLVATYNPGRQLVIVIRDADIISAYKIRAVPVGRDL